ncbi:MAG: glycosyltransferase [Luteimonas sp.]
MESAFCRLVPDTPASAKRRILASVTERLNRWCIEAAEITMVTQDGYRTSLLRRHLKCGHVVETSWIDAGDVLSPQDVARKREREAGGPLRLVFAGRLTAAKGIGLLLEAFRSATADGLDLQVDTFGSGPLEDECLWAVSEPAVAGRVRLRGNVPYDAAFFAALAECQVLVVPTLSDEQPRIVFDAYSQGLPVLASDTAGMKQCVVAGVTGWLFSSGHRASLHEAIARIAADRPSIERITAACIERARASTH